MPTIQQTHDLDECTLAELRAFVAATESLPGDARLYVRTGLGGGSRYGSRIKSITVQSQTRDGTS